MSSLKLPISEEEYYKFFYLSLPLSVKIEELTKEQLQSYNTQVIRRLLIREQNKQLVSQFVRNIVKNVYVIGDSHVGFWSGQMYDSHRNSIWVSVSCPITEGLGIRTIENNQIDDGFFKVFNLGQALAYNINTYGTSTRAREKIDYLLKSKLIRPNAWVMCCFGEIDMRAHLLKNGLENAPVRLQNILDNYAQFVKQLLNAGYKIIIYAPHASQKDEWYLNPEFPRAGSEIERNKWTLIFNTSLKEMCEQYKLPFLTCFFECVDKNLQTRAEFIHDECHLNQELYNYAVRQFNKEISLAICRSDF